MFAVWQELYDVSDNRYVNFILKQTSGTFDANWTYDYDMDLLIEATVPNVGTDNYRYYYRYTGGSSNPSSYRFFNRGEDEPFIFNEEDSDGTPIATISAELILSKLEYLMGYVEPQSLTPFNPTTNIPNTSLSDPGWETVKSNVTGIYLLTTRDDGYYVADNEATPIAWPQGQRSLMRAAGDGILS